MSDIPKSVRLFVRQREVGRCLRCGVGEGEGSHDIHHRQRRREAGHAVWTCILLCRTCHNWAHANPARARMTGFIISAHDPAGWERPIKAYWGWALIAEVGTIDAHRGPSSDDQALG